MKSKTLPPHSYKDTNFVASPFSPQKSTQFSFDIAHTQTATLTNSSVVAKQPADHADQFNNCVNNVTRVVHAGQTSDQYFNLRKNQAFLADMHSWSLTNATSLPFKVESRSRKSSSSKWEDWLVGIIHSD